MVITNMRGNLERTHFSADMLDAAGKLAYVIRYDCAPFSHTLLLADAEGDIVNYDEVAQPGPLSWEKVRAWAIKTAHAHIQEQLTAHTN